MAFEPVEIEGFVSKTDCKKLMKLIDKNHTRSSVVVENKDPSTISDERTSSTCCFDPKDPLINRLHNKIANYLKLDIRKGEGLQGQLYEKGQFFKKHNDFFTSTGYNQHCLHSGNRTHTLMIFLNDDFEGGGTEFIKLGKTITPKQGKALLWRNLDEEGHLIDESMHEGTEVTDGKKYIITSWWRENSWEPAKDIELYNLSLENASKTELKKSDDQSSMTSNNKRFTSHEDLSRVTDIGFAITKCPDLTWGLIRDSYELLKPHIKVEEFEGKKEIIYDGDSDIMSLEHLPTIKRLIHDQLHEIHEKWSGQKLVPSAIYGIRSYKTGAKLKLHRDRIKTHHISSIIIVDKDLEGNKDWPLDIQSHDGKWHKIYADPGDIILYESAVCEHGRNEPFEGKFFRNFYVHYYLKEWEFIG